MPFATNVNFQDLAGKAASGAGRRHLAKKRPGGPRLAPIDTLTVGRIWDAAEVRAYAERRGQRLADEE
ncbi:hypothetical protein [Micromonospora sp. NPDC005305]|uniref:hypothetical protein n=1 Tax=Micromonospora sp. NPDC005305 TaxID=3156875 RepID=UPI0033B42500